MDEEKETQEQEKEANSKAKSEGEKKEFANSNERLSVIDQAQKLKEENLKLLEETKAERKKLEKAAAEILLSGRGIIGNSPQKSEEEIKKEGAINFFKGTEIEKAIMKYG